MLDYLGVPYIQSTGEAEATAAALSAHGVSTFNSTYYSLLNVPIFSESLRNVLSYLVHQQLGYHSHLKSLQN